MATNSGFPEGYEMDANGPSANLQGLKDWRNKPIRTLLGSGGPLGIFGNMIGSQYEKAGAWNQEAMDANQQGMDDLSTMFKRESSTPFFQTEAGASGLQQLRRVLSDTLGAGQNNAVTGGATQEAQLAGRGEATQQYGDAVSKLTGYGTNRKDQLNRDYQYRLSQWVQNKMALQQGQAQSHANAAQQLIQAPMQFADSLYSGAQAFGSKALSAGLV